MKIKYLAIALLSTILVSSPLMANEKDIHKPLVVNSGIDKATPAASTSPDEMEMEMAKKMLEGEADEVGARTKGETTLGDISVVKELDKSSPVINPRDAASGLPSGKRQHKPVSVAAPIDKSTPILMKTRDAASGMATGKRQHSKLDPDSDDDGLTDEACDAIDNDCDTDTSEDSVNSKRAAYMKLGDIKGEATDKAADASIIKELDKSSTKAASSGYLKIGDIKGESQRATEGHGGAIAGIAIGAVAAEDTSDGGADEACAEIKENGTKEQLETCMDGHVTVLK